MSNLDETGQKIGQLIAILQSFCTLIDDSELDEFEKYLNRVDSTLWIFDPTAAREASQNNWIEKAKQRVKVIRAIKAVPVEHEVQS